MPPRYAYWTIIAGGLPTAFRAAHRDELMPTFGRLREKHPDAVMKWFARGKLWNSPEEARRDPDRRTDRTSGGRPGSGTVRGKQDRAHRGADGTSDTRGRDWRPGGDHRDPRQKHVDAKKARNLRRRQERFARKAEWEKKGRPPRPQHADRDRAAKPSRPERERQEPRERQEGWRPEGRGRNDRRASGFRNERAGGPSGSQKPGRGRAPHQPRGGTGGRPLERGGFPRTPARQAGRPPSHRSKPVRAQRPGTEDPPPPKRPRGPNREPRPSENPEPTPPPRPSEPAIAPPGPPERGRGEGNDE